MSSRTPLLVAPGVHLVRVGRAAAASNVYLVESEARWVLVDAGWAGSTGKITAAASQLADGIEPTAMVLTHIHPDHSGAAGALARSWDVPVYVHPVELAMAAGRYLPEYGMPLDRWVVVPFLRLLPSRSRRRLEQAGDITDVVRPLQPDGVVPGLPDWRWVHTPGHTPGHVAYHRPVDGLVITGDAVVTVDLNSVTGVLTGRRRVTGPPRYTTWSWPEAARSVATLAALEPQVLAPGHGRPLAVGAAPALHGLATQLTRPRAGRRTSGGKAGRGGS